MSSIFIIIIVYFNLLILFLWSFFFFSDYAYFFLFFFIFSSIRRHTRLTCDWSSDVCSSDLLLEGDRRLRRALDRVDLLGLDARYLGDLLRGRLTAQLGDQLALRAADLVELLDDVHRDADGPRLVGERASDRLADPPGRVGRELEPLAVVELLRGTDKAERALLDQVEEGQALVPVVLGDRDDQAEVRLDHLLLRVEVAALDPLGELDLLRRREQPDLADVLEEELQGIGRHVRLQVERLLAAATTLAVGPLGLRGGLLSRVEVLDQLDAVLLEVAVEVLDVRLVELDLGNGAGDVTEGQHAQLLALRDQCLHLFKLLDLRYQHSPTLFLPGCLWFSWLSGPRT